jgi:hypothetical protein
MVNHFLDPLHMIGVRRTIISVNAGRLLHEIEKVEGEGELV